MRVRVAARPSSRRGSRRSAHSDERRAPSSVVLVGPGVHDGAQLGRLACWPASGRGAARSRPPGRCRARSPREADAFRSKLAAACLAAAPRSRCRTRTSTVGRVADSAGARVARAEVAVGVVRPAAGRRRVLDLALPGPLRAMRGETSTHSRVSGLKRRCGCCFQIEQERSSS